MSALRKLPKLMSHRILSTSSSSSSSAALFISRRGIVTKLFVGGLSFYTTENGLLEAFSKHGQVIEAKVVKDRVSDRPKGFGFVTYASEDEAEKATREMNGKPLDGRVIFVDYARLHNNSGRDIIARGPPEPARGE
ncbi:hypothetical protein LIER_30121 [Lithospermum erythrorhizon]|uniref:RRM domain-containing protein n=1 Tax=Lithospermum erythrorhizon TaxID=34254 RepID=A0AAV3RLY8_LITER